MSLTAPERETVIVFSDADDTATVHTHQRRIITKLREPGRQVGGGHQLRRNGRRGLRTSCLGNQLPVQETEAR